MMLHLSGLRGPLSIFTKIYPLLKIISGKDKIAQVKITSEN